MGADRIRLGRLRRGQLRRAATCVAMPAASSRPFTACLDCRYRQAGGSVTITAGFIRDRIGISDTELDWVFEPFTRLDGSLSRVTRVPASACPCLARPLRAHGDQLPVSGRPEYGCADYAAKRSEREADRAVVPFWRMIALGGTSACTAPGKWSGGQRRVDVPSV